MKSLSDPFLRRPVLTLVISLLVLLTGIVSLPGLQVENLPPIAPGRVTVSASYPGASPEVVEQGVTTLLEFHHGPHRVDEALDVITDGYATDVALVVAREGMTMAV